MGWILGAIKGVGVGIFVTVFLFLFPAVAWFSAGFASDHWDMGFGSTFVAVILVETLIAFFALFGISSQLQKDYAEHVAQDGPHRSSR